MKTLLALLLVFAVGGNINANEVKSRSKRAAVTHVMSSEDKQRLVDVHNDYRGKVNPPAANMMYMTWDEEAAEVATNHSKGCYFKHNPKVPYHMGENLGMDTSSRGAVDKAIHSIGMFFDENKFYNYETTDCSSVCGHYTQVVWATTFKVGCGITLCDVIQTKAINYTQGGSVIVCNYSPGGNVYKKQPYINGTACSECGDGDVCVDNFCRNTVRDGLEELPADLDVGGGAVSINWQQYSTMVLILTVLVQANLVNYFL